MNFGNYNTVFPNYAPAQNYFTIPFTVRIYETQEEYECYEADGDDCVWPPEQLDEPEEPEEPEEEVEVNTAPYFDPSEYDENEIIEVKLGGSPVSYELPAIIDDEGDTFTIDVSPAGLHSVSLGAGVIEFVATASDSIDFYRQKVTLTDSKGLEGSYLLNVYIIPGDSVNTTESNEVVDIPVEDGPIETGNTTQPVNSTAVNA